MTRAYPKPENETSRLEMLASTNLLDSEKEAVFDKITEKAKQELGVEVALISLVDLNRQWFKSACGIDVSETPRDISFCTHAIMAKEAMVILDATKDVRFFDNPLVTGDPNIRFYAGAPIIIPDGLIIGTLCVIDSKAKTEFTQAETALLSSYADEVRQIVESRL